MDLFGNAYVWRVDNARELTAEELTELKKRMLETDEAARTLHDEWKRFEALAKTAREKKKKARWSEYSKKRDKAKFAFYGKLTILKRRKLKEIRRDELDEMMSTMTLKELRE